MDPKEKAKLKRKLKKEIEEIRQTVEELEANSEPVEPDNAMGRLGRMNAIGAQSVNESALRAAQQRLNTLYSTLRLIDSPTFGVCAVCSKPIPIERMEARPDSKVCVKCAEG